MNWKIFLPLIFAALLFVGGSTAALADGYGGHARSNYGRRVSPNYRYYGDANDYRWHKHDGRNYYDGRRYPGGHFNYGPSFRHYHGYPYGWQGGPFFGGTFFLPGWGVVFGGRGRW